MVLTIFFGVLGFGIMVFVHEFGHFIVAKLVGIEVEVFSLGWGKKMIGFERGGTSYQISWFPIGGYCRMKGDDPLKSDGTQKQGSFFAATPYRRIMVAAAGPLANILFAVLVLTLIWWIGFKVYSDENRIVLVSDYSLDALNTQLPATTAGLKTGDRIFDINGQAIENFQNILVKVSISPGEKLVLLIEREGRMMTLEVVPELDTETGAGKIGVYAWRYPVIDKVRPDGSAGLASLMKGDRIISLNGREIHHTIDFYQIINEKPEELELVFLRDNVKYNRNVVLHYGEDGIPDPGITFKLSVYPSPDVRLPGAIVKGVQETARTLSLTVKGISLLFRGVNLRNAVAGPLRITYYVGTVATSGFAFGISEGLVSFFRFLCLLSIVLFLMNLLPIPALDGGQIMIFLLEIFRGKPVNPKIVYKIQVVGFSILILVFIAVTFSDILFFMGR